MQSRVLINLAFCGQGQGSPGTLHLLSGISIPALEKGWAFCLEPTVATGRWKMLLLAGEAQFFPLHLAVGGLLSKGGSSVHPSHLF